MKKFLFVYTNFSSFVRTDYEILSSKFDVDKYQYNPVKGLIRNTIEFFKQFVFMLFNAWKFDGVFIWFADYHSFLPILFAKLLGKKSIVVIGGYDVACIPELNYGSFCEPFRAWFTRISLKNATLCLPDVDDLDRKLKILVPSAKSKITYTGFDPQIFEFGETAREPTVLTISMTKNYQRYKLKGLDRFVELARHLPEFTFVMTGLSKECEAYIGKMPSNLVIKRKLPFEKLLNLMKTSSFYAQLSVSEGLPSTICETMLCGCIPIGTNLGGIKTGIGDCGYTGEWKVEEFRNFILDNHENENLRKRARQRVVNNFTTEIRKNALFEILD